MVRRTETEHKAQTTGFLVTFTKEPLVEAAGYFLEQSFQINEFIPVFFPFGTMKHTQGKGVIPFPVSEERMCEATDH